MALGDTNVGSRPLGGIVQSHDELAVALDREGLQKDVETFAVFMREGDANVHPEIFLFGPLDDRVDGVTTRKCFDCTTSWT